MSFLISPFLAESLFFSETAAAPWLLHCWIKSGSTKSQKTTKHLPWAWSKPWLPLCEPHWNTSEGREPPQRTWVRAQCSLGHARGPRGHSTKARCCGDCHLLAPNHRSQQVTGSITVTACMLPVPGGSCWWGFIKIRVISSIAYPGDP